MVMFSASRQNAVVAEAHTACACAANKQALKRFWYDGLDSPRTEQRRRDLQHGIAHKE